MCMGSMICDFVTTSRVDDDGDDVVIRELMVIRGRVRHGIENRNRIGSYESERK